MPALQDAVLTLPRALADYPAAGGEWVRTVVERVAIEPFNAVATAIFALAILHTFLTGAFTRLAHAVERRADASARAAGRSPQPAFSSRVLHVLGEVEAVFALWAVVLIVAMVSYAGWATAARYLRDGVTYTEPLFVVVIMTLAATRPIVRLAEGVLLRLAAIGGATPAAVWTVVLIAGPLLGSFITEPAAMTICALLLAHQFYDLDPSVRLKYATLGLLFVNISIGGTLTHFAAPPVLMVARPWGWDTPFMLAHVGWRAAVAIVVSTLLYRWIFRAEFRTLARRREPGAVGAEGADDSGSHAPVPAWVTAVHVLLVVWTVVNAHHPVRFLAGFAAFLAFARATAFAQGRLELKAPLMVGLFLGGLVIHGGLQGWWIAPLLASLPEEALFVGASLLTAFNDNALITYLATLVPGLDGRLAIAVVQGAVTGGGLTVIANAPNPAGQALLGRFFGGTVSPVWLAAGALAPTLIAAALFRLI